MPVIEQNPEVFFISESLYYQFIIVKPEPTEMKNINKWIDVLIFNFCVVALLGFTLRSKILFSIPFLDYNRLLDAHFHFAFGGWVTLALVVLFIKELLTPEQNTKGIYKWLPVCFLVSSWILLISSPLPANSIGASLCSTVFIFITYVFSWSFLSDLRKVNLDKTIKLLATSAVVCLVLSSAGVFALAFLFATKSLNTFAYRDALYTYLHLQYNGFFTLGVFAILFHKLLPKMSVASQRLTYRFSIWLTISTLPSLFLTYLWRDPHDVYRVLAICGSITLLISFIYFVALAISLKEICASATPLIRVPGYLAMAAFSLKIFLQSFTLFPAIGNVVFGDRPVIIGFLHLVFLGFVTLFLFAWFAQRGYLNLKLRFTQFAIVFFAAAVVLNEAVLMTQGLGVMFIKSSSIFPWLLWGLSIMLLIGAVMIGWARKLTRPISK